MSTQNPSTIIQEYRKQLEDARLKTTRVSAALQDEAVLDGDTIESLADSLRSLRFKYEDLHAAACRLAADEAPATGLPGSQYVKVIEASCQKDLAQQVSDRLQQIDCFCLIWTSGDETGEVQTALQQEQAKARDLARQLESWQELSWDSVHLLLEQSAGFAYFIDAVSAPSESKDRKAAASLVQRHFSKDMALWIFYDYFVLPAEDVAESASCTETMPQTVEAPAGRVLSGSDTEDGSTMSSENAQPDISRTALTSKLSSEYSDASQGSEDDETADQITWSILGISSPDRLRFSVPAGAITERQESAKKTFGVKAFKGDFERHYNWNAEKAMLASLANHGYTCPELAYAECAVPDAMQKSSIDDLRAAAEHLLKNGYLCWTDAGNLGGVYRLTPKGQAIFSSATSLNYLFKNSGRLKWMKEMVAKHATENESWSIEMIAARIILCNTLTHVLGSSERKPDKYRWYGRAGGHAVVMQNSMDLPVVGIAVCTGKEPEEFLSFLSVIDKAIQEANPDLLIVSGIDIEQSKAVAEWMCSPYGNTEEPEESSGCHVWYTSMSNDEMYDMDGETGDLALFQALFGNKPDNATDSAKSKGHDKDLDVVENDSPALSAAPPCALDDSDRKAPATHDSSLNKRADALSHSELDARHDAKKQRDHAAMDSGTSPSVIAHSKRAAENHALDTDPQNPTAPVVATHPKTAATAQLDEDVMPESSMLENALEMISDGKTYCALVALRALGQTDAASQQAYKQLAYAANDPAFNCSYNAASVMDVFSADIAVLPRDVLAAAALRSYFYETGDYDRQLKDLWDLVFGYPGTGSAEKDELYRDLNQIMYQLKEFKTRYHTGVDVYADYRRPEREANDGEERRIAGEAANLYETLIKGQTNGQIREKRTNPRFIETRKLLLSANGDLARYLDAVRKGNQEILPDLKKFLLDTYLQSGSSVDSQSIDATKFNRLLDQKWSEAGESMRRHKDEGMNDVLRSSLRNHIQRIVTLLCDFVINSEARIKENSDAAARRYDEIRPSLLSNLKRALDTASCSRISGSADMAGRVLLEDTLQELVARVDGSFDEDSRRYFYLPFLAHSEIVLDQDTLLPVMEAVQDVADLSMFRRAQRHAAAPDQPLEDRLRQICESNDEWSADLGSARLIQQYLQDHPDEVQDKSVLTWSLDIGPGDPRGFLNAKLDEFQGILALAQHDGQLDFGDTDHVDEIIQILSDWCDWAEQTQNYAFCGKIFRGLRQKIREDATARANYLTDRLETYKRSNPDWEGPEHRDSVLEVEKRIEMQKYAAAEDLLNRLTSDDLDLELAGESHDHLQEFLDEYDANYDLAGSTAKAIKAPPALREGKNKDARGGMRLIDNWPSSPGAPEARIKSLLEALGFPVRQIRSKTVGDTIQYAASLDFGDQDYSHPVSVFGSDAATNDFRVFPIFGRMDAERLIDKFAQLGDTKNTLILLNYSLTLPDRRKLARLSKEKFRTKTFLVLDRVGVMYLARHYSETAVNRMLMEITMPFAAASIYQPSSSQEMPPELFIGRTAELDSIISPGGASIVYGGRQLGKTALLRKAQQDVNQNENGDRAIWIDIKGLDYLRAAEEVSLTLYEEGILSENDITSDWDRLAHSIRSRLKNGRPEIPYLLLLLDEADAFIKSCRDVHYQPLEALKSIQNIGRNRFKFVAAGLHNVVRFHADALDNNLGLTHLESLNVKPFKYREARELLEVPLSYLGFRFPEDENTARLESTIFTTTNYFPGLIQLYCAELIRTLQRSYGGYLENVTPPYTVSDSLIQKVLQNEDLLKQIQEKFDITIKVDKGEDDYYHLIALLAAYHSRNADHREGFTAEDIASVARDYEIRKVADLAPRSLQALMEEMKDLNIFNRMKDGHYRFARRRFLEMMGTARTIDDEILAYGGQ